MLLLDDFKYGLVQVAPAQSIRDHVVTASILSDAYSTHSPKCFNNR